MSLLNEVTQFWICALSYRELLKGRQSRVVDQTSKISSDVSEKSLEIFDNLVQASKNRNIAGRFEHSV